MLLYEQMAIHLELDLWLMLNNILDLLWVCKWDQSLWPDLTHQPVGQ